MPFFIHFLLGTYLFLTIQLTEVACILRRTFFHCQSYEVFFSMRMWRSIHTWMRRGNCTHGDGVHWILFSLLPHPVHHINGVPCQSLCLVPIDLSRYVLISNCTIFAVHLVSGIIFLVIFINIIHLPIMIVGTWIFMWTPEGTSAAKLSPGLNRNSYG